MLIEQERHGDMVDRSLLKSLLRMLSDLVTTFYYFEILFSPFSKYEVNLLINIEMSDFSKSTKMHSTKSFWLQRKSCTRPRVNVSSTSATSPSTWSTLRNGSKKKTSDWSTILIRYSFSQMIQRYQWFLTFFAPWTPRSQKKFHGPLNYQSVLLVDPCIPVKAV